MAANILLAIIFGLMAQRANSMGLDLESVDNELMEDDDRTIIVATGLNLGNVLGINLTQLLPLLALAAAALLPLLCICALAAVLAAAALSKDNSSYGGYGGYGSSYSEYSRALGLDSIDWEKLSIIDWVSMGEETFRKFEPTNLDCQKRLICELHQNAQNFGPLASTFVNIFGYLRYVQVLSLPEMVKSTVDEYLDAADRGHSVNKQCGDIFSDCDFSIKSMYDRYSGNEI